MTGIPKYLTDFDNRSTVFPFYMDISHVNHYEAHRHDFLEFTLVTSGTGTEYINGKPHIMQPGTFSFILPYQIHEIQADPGETLSYYKCNFMSEFLLGSDADSELEALLFGADDELPPFVATQASDFDDLIDKLSAMYHEYQEQRLWYKSMIRGKLVEVLVAFDRHRRPAPRKHTISPLTQRPKSKTIWNVIHYVYSNFSSDISLTLLADRFELNVSHLSSQFKKHIGMNFVDFLNDIRIRHACGLLSTTNMKVTDIAYEVGYGSYKTFSRVFRNLKLSTPNEYRSKRNASYPK